MLAEELVVLDGDGLLWREVRPLLDAALRLEQNDDAYTWHGWSKQQINTFLKNLPSHCSLIVGVWETVAEGEGDDAEELERLRLGFVCEVVEGEVCSVSTFESFLRAGLKPIQQLEPGAEDALEVMRLTRLEVAPVAWALFTEKAMWDEWLFASGDDGAVIDKGELLASFARMGRCVLMGDQAGHHHH